MFHTITTLLLLHIGYAQLYDPNAYSLGNNLVTNPTFTSPTIPTPLTYQDQTNTILGWNCIGQVCQILHIPRMCVFLGLPCSTQFQQGIDMDVWSIFVTISQIILITSPGQYLLTVEWMAPIIAPIGKSF